MEEFEHRLYIAVHLSIVDGLSVYQFLPAELAAAYQAFCVGRPSSLPTPTSSFADYAYWQRQWMGSEEMGLQLAYWRNQLGGDVVDPQLPGEKPRPNQETYRGSIRSYDLPAPLRDTTKKLSHQQGATLFTYLLANFVTLLHGCTQRDDIIVGTLAPSGRKQARFQGLMGHFLNPVALRFNLTGNNTTFSELLAQARRVVLEAISNDDVPIEILQQNLRPKVDGNSGPFFRVAISLQPPMPPTGLEWSVSTMDVDSGGSPWDLYIAFIDAPDRMMARIQYSSEIFETEAIDALWQRLQRVLECANENPECRLSEFTSRLT
jgi:hypothetical protein